MAIILMRHGRTFSNARGYLDTRPPGAGLTEIGQLQALAAGQYLRELSPNLGMAVSSVAWRAQQSLQLALFGYGATDGDVPGVGSSRIPTAVVPGIHEIFAGDYEGHNSDAAHRHYDSALVGWKAGDLDARMPGGESAGELLDRFVPALLAAYEQADGDLLVVSHGAAIRLVGIHGLRQPNGDITGQYIANGSLTVLEPEGEFGQWRCRLWAGYP